jgi:hypothetical protein
MWKVGGERTIKSSMLRQINSVVCEDLKDSRKKVDIVTEKEKLSCLKDRDFAVCSSIETNVTGSASSSKMSELGKWTQTLTTNRTGQAVLMTMEMCETGNSAKVEKGHYTKEKKSRTLVVRNCKVSDSRSGQAHDKRVTKDKAQSIYMAEENVPSEVRYLGVEEDEHCVSQREFSSLVNTVEPEVNLHEKTIERMNHSHVVSEAPPCTDSEPSVVSEDNVSALQETEGTIGASNESHGDFVRISDSSDSDKAVPNGEKFYVVPLGNSIEASPWHENRNCTDTEQGTKDSALKRLTECVDSKKTEKTKHEAMKSHTPSEEAKDDGVTGCDTANSSSVPHQKSDNLKENASVRNCTGSGGEIGNSKTRVDGIGKPVAGKSFRHTFNTSDFDENSCSSNCMGCTNGVSEIPLNLLVIHKIHMHPYTRPGPLYVWLRGIIACH